MGWCRTAKQWGGAGSGGGGAAGVPPPGLRHLPHVPQFPLADTSPVKLIWNIDGDYVCRPAEQWGGAGSGGGGAAGVPPPGLRHLPHVPQLPLTDTSPIKLIWNIYGWLCLQASWAVRRGRVWWGRGCGSSSSWTTPPASCPTTPSGSSASSTSTIVPFRWEGIQLF